MAELQCNVDGAFTLSCGMFLLWPNELLFYLLADLNCITRVCLHGVLLARIGRVFCITNNVPNNAPITAVKTPTLNKVVGVYFLQASLNYTSHNSKIGHILY